jgi:hypothetical protein
MQPLSEFYGFSPVIGRQQLCRKPGISNAAARI